MRWYRAADNDVNAAVNDVRVQAIECLIRTCNFIKESLVEDYATVYECKRWIKER
jgi:hypothetical protein